MKHLKTIFFALFALVALQVSAAPQFSNESLKYVITYKWGLIHKEAGEATMSLHRSGDRYDLMLVAKTKPWADKIFKVRDTLVSSLRVSDLKPLKYEKRVHEKNKNALDRVVYSHANGVTSAKVTKFRVEDGKNVAKEFSLSASGPVYDMLSIFYYIRKLDYSKLDKYKSYTATIFSGSKKETVKIKSLGLEKLTMRDKSVRDAYHIKFNFTQHGGKKSSDDIDAWISADSSHIPLYLVGKLPIGEVQVYLTK